MSTTTITFTITANGEKADATSVTLADPTGSYGVRRTDTGDVVVASGTAFDHPSIGIYQYSFTDPAPNLTYEVWITWTYSGATYREQRMVNGSDPPIAAIIDACAEIELYQGSVYAFTLPPIVDADGNAVDLSGKTLTFAAATEQTASPPVFSRSTGGAGVTVGGDDNNVVTIALEPAQTGIAQRLNATLWNTTDGTVLAVRKLNIKPAAQQS